MSSENDNQQSYSQVKQRLDSIVSEVRADGVSLDEALALYEEAVGLALKATDMLEVADPSDGQEASEPSEPSSAQLLNQEGDAAGATAADASAAPAEAGTEMPPAGLQER